VPLGTPPQNERPSLPWLPPFRISGCCVVVDFASDSSTIFRGVGQFCTRSSKTVR
jgi:hypothetical protein